MVKAVVFLGKKPTSFRADVFKELLQDEEILDKLNNHPGSTSERVRDVLVPEAVKRGYKAVEVPLRE